MIGFRKDINSVCFWETSEGGLEGGFPVESKEPVSEGWEGGGGGEGGGF